MKLPSKDIGNWASEIAQQCFVSQKERVSDAAKWKEYFFSGTADGRLATLNMCFPHIDRMASSLFSPADTHFSISFDQEKPKPVNIQAKVAGRYLSQEFHRRGVDLEVASALEWALMKGSAFLKLNWGHEGLDPLVVQPESFGVLNETICGLDRQEAFCHKIYMTEGMFVNYISGHPKEKELLENVGKMQSTSTEDDATNDYFHQVVIGGTNPIYPVGQTNNTPGTAMVFGAPQAQLSAEVKRKLIVVNELWVQDDERQDYTTIQFVEPNIVIEGELRRRNLCGIAGEQPYRQICANPIDGYFWGKPELQPLSSLQDMLNRRMGEYDRISKLRSNPPRMFKGGVQLTDNDKLAVASPGGYFAPTSPNAGSESLAPELPPELQKQIGEIMSWFDYVGGFENITKGQGEAGVRSGSHADTLVRMASARLRDRSLLIERQCADVADFCLKVLQNKNANQFQTKDGLTFLLDQLPEDSRVHVDSHSSSPAFAQEAKQTAMELLKVGAITPKDFIMLTHPPMEDMLVEAAEEREKAAAQEKKEIYEEAKKDPSLMAKLVGSMGKRK
jgi:hypothetical protein